MTTRPLVLLPAALGAVLAWGGTPAAAAVTTYTSQAAFDAAVTGETTFGFDEGNSTTHYHVAANPYRQSGIGFADNVTAADTATGGVPILFLIGNATTPTYGVDFLSFQNTQVGVSADLTSRGVTALGFDYASYIVGGPATVAVNGGLPAALTVTGTPQFIGFTSTTPITDISVVFPGAYSFDLTSVSDAGAVAGAVPEPASWALMLAGFGVVGVARRRRMTVVAA